MSAGGTSAGSVASVAKPMGETQKRSTVAGLQPVENVMKKKATKKGPYQNSLVEGKVKELVMDLKSGNDGLTDVEFKKKYGKTKQEMRKSLKQQPEQKDKVEEAKLEEEDKIISPDKGRRLKTGLHGKNTELTPLGKFRLPFKSEGLWVSDARGTSVLECVHHTLAPIVAKALNAYASMNEDFTTGGVIAGGGVGEGLVSEKAVSKKQQRFFGMAHALQKGKKIPNASKELKDVAKGISKKAAHDYAATKHKGLPEKVKKD